MKNINIPGEEQKTQIFNNNETGELKNPVNHDNINPVNIVVEDEKNEDVVNPVAIQVISCEEQASEEQEAEDAEPFDLGSIDANLSIIEIVELLLNMHYNFRYNEVTGVMEFKSIWDSKFVDFADRDLFSIHRKLQKQKINFCISSLYNLIYSDFSQRYNPFYVYYYSLPEWDGSTDYISQLANTVKTSNQEFWQKCFRKWIIAATACVLVPEEVNHTAIVFTGSQGVGKTTWLINLCPSQLKRYVYSGSINLANKDTTISLSECFFINLDELENLNKSEIGSLKEIITKNNIRLRRPYGRINETFIRRASFMGSVNTTQFLNDSTGSRRFLCFETVEIEYQHNVNLDMVYAQALALYKSGEIFHFTKEDIAEVTTNNEQFQNHSFEEELLLEYFSPVDPENAEVFWNATQFLTFLTQKTKSSVNNKSTVLMGKALTKNGFVRLKKKKIWCYAAKFNSKLENENQPTQAETTDSDNNITI